MRKKGGLGKGLAALIPATPEIETETGGAVATEVGPEGTGHVSRETSSVPEPRKAQASDVENSAPKPNVSRETAPDEKGDTEEELLPVPGAQFQLVRLDEISMNPKQPRQVFDEAGLEELKISMSEIGLLQPIAVRESSGETPYELILGERRTRAASELGWESIPAIVRETKDEELLRDALLENIHRVQLNPLEEGAAYQQLLEEFGVTQEELSRRIGRSRPQISNTIRLLSLPPAVQRRVAAGVLSAGHARAILGLSQVEKQDKLAARIVAEGLSVRATEELVSLESGSAAAETGDVSRETGARKNKAHAPGLSELADRLSDHFETRVKVSLGQKKGRVTIEFGSVADLERISAKMGLPVEPEA